jgi:hypothetical protein
MLPAPQRRVAVVITRPLVAAAALFLTLASLDIGSALAVTLGFRESFPLSGGLAGWSGGAFYDNPGAGGAGGGADDGFLSMTVAGFAGNLGGTSFGADYTGNWQTAGISEIRLWLKDIGADDPIEIHCGIGYNTSPTARNFWQYNTGFIPSTTGWTQYTVPLNGPGGWTRIIGTTGTFANAIQNVDRLHFRHDLSPYMQTPDPVIGDFGIDEILLTNGTVGVEDGPIAAGQPVMLGAPFPNPSRGPLALSLHAGSAGPVTIEIVDVQGRLMRRERLAPAAAGPRLWMWDGRDDRGALVAPGSYRARAFGAEGGTSRSFVVVR